MKKISMLSLSILSLTVVLTVSSFAWFKLLNEGKLNVNIPTKTGVDIYFSQVDSQEGAMMPAKLKKGVLNGSDDFYINGQDKVPFGEEVLPEIDDDYNYIIDEGTFKPKNRYLEKPASIVYNQFELYIPSQDHDNLNTNLSFSFFVKYYEVDQDEETEVYDLKTFMQTEALAFNFYVLKNNKLTKDQLNSISTADQNIVDKIKLEKLFFNENITLNNDEIFGSLVNFTDIKSYQYQAVGNNQTGEYTFNIKNLNRDEKYSLLIESYYSLPDALIDGNLPLTGKFVLNMSYKIVL